MNKTLATYIAEKNAATLAWVAEAPTVRFATTLVDDVEYWARNGVTTPEGLEHYLLACDVYESTREVWGYKPSWAGLMAQSTAELRESLARMAQEAERQREEEKAEKAARIAKKHAETQKAALVRKVAMTRKPWKLGHFLGDVLSQVRVA